MSAATRVRLNSCYTRTSAQPFVVNGAALQLDPLSAHLVTALSGLHSPTIAELERLVPGATAEAIRSSVMNLSRYELVTRELR